MEVLDEKCIKKANMPHIEANNFRHAQHLLEFFTSVISAIGFFANTSYGKTQL